MIWLFQVFRISSLVTVRLEFSTW